MTGRPALLHQVIDHRNGRPITSADRVVELTSLGTPRRAAAAAAGISVATLMAWISLARTTRAALHVNPQHPTTPHQNDCLAFLDQLERAEGEAVARVVAQIQAAAAPHKGRKTKTTRRYTNAQGQKVEEVTEVEVDDPGDWRAAAFLAERRWPEAFSAAVQVTGPGGGAIQVEHKADEDRASALVASVREVFDVQGREA